MAFNKIGYYYDKHISGPPKEVIEMRKWFLTMGLFLVIVLVMACGSDEALRAENQALKAALEQYQTTHEIFELYTADVDTYETVLYMQVSIEKNLTLEEKLNTLMTKLSYYYFNAPIALMGIDLDGEEQIAVFNLLPESDGTYDKWVTGFFQGSTGGAITAKTLVETALQKQYQGEWIVGVRFLYDGKNIEYDHVYGLSDIHRR